MDISHVQMREIAIAIDEAQQRAPMPKGGMNYELALCAVRGCRAAIDDRPERANVVHLLQTLMYALQWFRGGRAKSIDPAIGMVEQLIEDIEPQTA